MGVAVKELERRWPGREIPYDFASGIESGIQNRIAQALHHWESKTLYRFVPLKEDEHYAWLHFVEINSGQHSDVGRQGTQQDPKPTVVSLSVTSSRGNAIHEVGHALGLKHEQNRIKRNENVTIRADRIQGGKIRQFAEADPATHENVGPHDYDSIMHYSQNAFAKPRSDTWSSGWTAATFYEVGGEPFGLFLKQRDGLTHVHELTSTGGIDKRIAEYTWGSGWTHVQAFASGGKTYLFAFKHGDRTCHVNEIRSSGENKGKVGSNVFKQKLTQNWTDFGFFEGGGKTYLFMLKSDDGKVRVREVVNGAPGAEADSDTWSAGWSTAVTYKVGSKWFLFALRGGSGEVDIHRLESTGNVDRRLVEDHYWTAGWTDAAFYEYGGTTYLLLIKEGTGEVHIHEVNSDGSVGAEVERHDWSPRWTVVEPYSVGSDRYLFMLKSGDGTVHLHELDSDGEVDGRVRMTPTIITKDKIKQRVIGQRKRLSPWDVFTASSRALCNASVNRMNTNGSLGPPIDARLWGDGWTHVVPFTTPKGTFLFFMRGGTGFVDIHRVLGKRAPAANFFGAKPIAAGEIGTLVGHYEWGGGWTSVCSYRAGGRTFLFMIKEEGGDAIVNELDDDGKWKKQADTDEVVTLDWSDDWTTAVSFVVGEPYLFLLKEGEGRVSIHHLMNNGKVGKEVYWAKGWSKGWTTATTYEVGGQVYLFLLKEKDGDFSISHLLKGGHLGKELPRKAKWGEGWTHAVPFEVNGAPFLFTLKSGEGDVKIRRIGSGGEMGGVVYEGKWSENWTAAAAYETGGETLLITLQDEALDYE